MNEQEQRIALCEWAGWRIEHQNKEGTNWVKPDGDIITHWKDEPSPLPDTSSLDVLHSFAMKIRAMPGMEWTHYNETLLKLCNGYKWDAANATPEQRRKAMLIALNLWREDSNEGRK